MKRSRPVSITDVAKAAGVSTATVSRVVNNGTVSAATRVKVERVISRLGYVPDQQAATLRSGRTRKIGLVLPDIANPAYALTASLAHEHLRELGYSLVFGITYGSVDEEIQILQMLRRERVSGAILNTCEGEDDTRARPELERLIAAGARIVFTGPKDFDLGVDTFSVDNLAGVKKLVEYLARTGRRRVGFIAGDGDSPATRGRLAGFRAGLKSAGLKAVRGADATEGSYTQDNGRRLAERVLASHDLDALVCGNDMMALGALQAAEAMRVPVPKRLAVAGFDDIPVASLVHPKLTTVRQPFDRIIPAACRTLVNRIEGKPEPEPRHHSFEPELVVRESA